MQTFKLRRFRLSLNMLYKQTDVQLTDRRRLPFLPQFRERRSVQAGTYTFQNAQSAQASVFADSAVECLRGLDAEYLAPALRLRVEVWQLTETDHAVALP